MGSEHLISCASLASYSCRRLRCSTRQ